MKNVLWLMQFDPHFREDLLRELGQICNLTIRSPPVSHFGMAVSLVRAQRFQAILALVEELANIGRHFFLRLMPHAGHVIVE